MITAEIRQYFSRLIQKDQISHAFILQGKQEICRNEANYFAAMLQCQQKNHCGVCRSCLLWEGNNHPDIIRVSHEKPESIGVDEIRQQLVEDMSIKPYHGPYKIYLVEEAEKLTVAAQNALLKTIEEPPTYGILLLLTTNAQKLLPTILSRCVLLSLHGEDTIPELNEGVGEELLVLLGQIPKKTIAQIDEEIKNLKEKQSSLPSVIEMIRLWARDLLVWKATEGEGNLFLPQEERAYRKFAPEITYPGMEKIFREIEKTEQRLRDNVNDELAMEMLLLAMKREMSKSTPTDREEK